MGGDGCKGEPGRIGVDSGVLIEIGVGGDSCICGVVIAKGAVCGGGGPLAFG